MFELAGAGKRAILLEALLLALVALCAGVASPRSALAAPTEEERKIAGRYYEQAAEAYSQGEYDKAIEFLDKAFVLDSDPTILYNLGRSHEGAGHLDDAERILTRVQEDARTPDELRKRVKTDLKRLANLKAGRIKLGQLTVTSTPAGARLFIDGQVEGRTPFAGNIEVGKHTVLIQLDGYQSTEQDVDIASQGPSQVDVALVAIGGGGGDGSVSGTSGLAIGAYVALGLGTAAMATGIGTYFAADAKLTELERYSTSDRAKATAARDDGKALALVSNISYGVGFAGLGIGAALLVWSLTEDDTDTQASLAPETISVDPRGAVVLGWSW